MYASAEISAVYVKASYFKSDISNDNNVIVVARHAVSHLIDVKPSFNECSVCRIQIFHVETVSIRKDHAVFTGHRIERNTDLILIYHSPDPHPL